MADVIDIIHKLSYDVDDTGLQRVIAELQQQSASVDRLRQRLIDLNRLFDTSMAVQQQSQLRAAIDRTTEAIRNQGNAMLNTVQSNKQLSAMMAGGVPQGLSHVIGGDGDNGLKEKFKTVKEIVSGLAKGTKFLNKAAEGGGFVAKLFGSEAALNALKGVGLALNMADGVGEVIAFGLAVAELVKHFNDHAEAVKRAREQTELYKQVVDGVVDNAVANASQEIARADILATKAADINLPMKERLDAVNELQQRYPDYLKNLSQEAILNGQIGTSLDQLNKKLIYKAVLDEFAKDMAVAYKNKIALTNQLNEENDRLSAPTKKVDFSTAHAMPISTEETKEQSRAGTQSRLLTKALTAQNEFIENIKKNTLKVFEALATDWRQETQPGVATTVSPPNTQKQKKIKNIVIGTGEIDKEQLEAAERKREEDAANAYARLNSGLQSDTLRNDENIVHANSERATPDLGAYLKVAEDKNLKLQQDSDAEQKVLQDDFNATMFKNEQERSDKEKELQQQAAASKATLLREQHDNEFAAYKGYFDELEGLIKKRSEEIIAADELKTDQTVEALSKKLADGSISRASYEYRKHVIGLQVDLKTDKHKLTENADEQYNIQKQLFNPTLSVSETNDLNDRLTKLKDEAAKLGTDINEKEDAIKKAHTEHIEEQIDKYSELVKTVVSAYDQIYEAQQRALDREIQIREQRVQQANMLAERGNTQALQQEQSLLDKAQRQRELAAKRQVEINAALSASEAVLAVVKAAAEGDPYTIAIRVIAAVASIAAGVASIKATTQSEANLGFAHGGYTGDGARYQIAGPVHRGEFVFDHDKTRMYRPLFEAIHNGMPMFERMPDTVALRRYEQSTTINNAFATRHDMNLLAEKLDGVADAIGDIRVEQHIGENGVRQMVQTSMRKERKRWKV